jgi:hypothetical protein
MTLTIPPLARRVLTALAAAIAVASTGCSSTTDLAGIVPISLDNAEAVTTRVVDTMQTVIAVGMQGGDTTDSVSGVTVPTAGGVLHLTAFSKTFLEAVVGARDQNGPAAVAGAIVDSTIPCDKGDISIVQTDSGDGPVYTMTFNSCDEKSLNVTFDGTMAISNVQITGDLSTPATPGSMAAKFDISAVAAVDRGGSTSLQGVFDYAINTDDGVTFNQTIHGARLSLSRSDDSSTLSTFDFTVTVDSNTSEFSFTATGNLYSTLLGGSVTFVNEKPFTGMNVISDSPDHGTMRITGRANTNILMTVITNGSLTLAIDADGNGSVDDSLHSKWTAVL